MTFPKEQVYCVLDYETYSEADLKAVGAFEYSMHPSTEVLCLAYRIGTKETLKTAQTHTWSPKKPSNTIVALLSSFENKDVILVAHNAYFEQVITKNVLARHLHTQEYLAKIPSDRWVCTASLAAALALPRHLEGAALALKLPVQKDMDGRRLILKWCKPRKPSKKNASTRHNDPEEFDRLVAYCKTDVDTEVELFLRVPHLTPTERQVWLLDQKINLRGFKVDRGLVERVLAMIVEENMSLEDEVWELTQGQIETTNQRQKLLEWFWENDCRILDLQRATVDAALQEPHNDYVHRMLEIRSMVSKTSTAKYEAFEQRSRHDSRLRDVLLYHGASTGRWSGMGIQPQNFPRGNIKDTIAAAETLATGDLEWVRTLYKDPMNVFSSCLRNVIIAPEGKTLDVADYASIETRVLFWVANHEEGMNAFREGRDLYKEVAARIYGTSPERIKDGSFERFLGKSAVLGCGYGMGFKKFVATCLSQGQEISEELGKTAVNAYRETHSPVPKLWGKIGLAAITAVQNPGKKYTINHTAWFMKGEFLFCELPSGRRLAYYGPQIVHEMVFNERRPVLYHYGVNAVTRQWELQKTWGGTLVENVVQAIARDLMAEAMLRIEATKHWQIVLSVHDELIAERHDVNLPAAPTNEQFCKLMAEVPSWAEGCPVAVAGWSGPRYKKG